MDYNEFSDKLNDNSNNQSRASNWKVMCTVRLIDEAVKMKIRLLIFKNNNNNNNNNNNGEINKIIIKIKNNK